jgi:NAD+ diphosphatase
MRNAEAVTFAGGSIDRAAHLRGDAAALVALRAREDARVLPLWRLKPLLDRRDGGHRLAWLPAAASPVRAVGDAIFLGLEEGAPRFACEVGDWQTEPAAEATGFVDTAEMAHPDLDADLRFCDLRATMGALDATDAGNAAAARGAFAWHATHGFCARCGVRSEIDLGGWRRHCPGCGAHHFPRTDPVVIMLILHGNSVLLGRAPSWPEGMYSLLAGFMEPGESIEAAVRRETFEEAGVTVGEVQYLSSQPWPFPSSLMIGCMAEAEDRAITRDPEELEDARWVTREEVLAGMTGALPGMRPARRGSIARFLIERWLADRLR